MGVVQGIGNLGTQFSRLSNGKRSGRQPIRKCHTFHEVADDKDGVVFPANLVNANDIGMK